MLRLRLRYVMLEVSIPILPARSYSRGGELPTYSQVGDERDPGISTRLT